MIVRKRMSIALCVNTEELLNGQKEIRSSDVIQTRLTLCKQFTIHLIGTGTNQLYYRII